MFATLSAELTEILMLRVMRTESVGAFSVDTGFHLSIPKT